jgi:hypothetical protein
MTVQRFPSASGRGGGGGVASREVTEQQSLSRRALQGAPRTGLGVTISIT